MSEERVLERLRERDSSVKPARSGRGLAAFAVLLALAGLGLAAYPYYQKMGHGTSPAVSSNASLATASDEAADLRHALDSAVAGLDDRLQQQQLRQSARLDALDAQVAAAAHSPADDAATAASTARLVSTFKLAEAQQLLQSANDRLVLMGDGAGALALMLAAQQVLADVDTPAVLRVRAKLNDEITALRGDPGVDVNATFVRIEKLKQNLPDSPARAGFVATNLPAPAGDVPISVWQQVVRKFMSLFDFRRNNAAGQRPLTLDEVDHLRLSLELLLQTAQLALLRDDALVYTESLTAARTSLDAYRANNGDKVAAAEAEIDKLLAIPLHRTLPDVSGSLTELRTVIGVVTPKPSAQPVATPDAAAADPALAPSSPQ